MKRMIPLVLVVACAASVAWAGTIQDIRTGLVPEGSIVDVEGAVVTAVMHTSVTIAEMPGGPNLALWVITDGAPTVSVGDVVDLRGTYLEHNERSTLSLLYPDDAHMTVTGAGSAPEVFATVDELLADPEAWESVAVDVTDGLIVQEILEDGNWVVTSFETGSPLVLNDYFGLFPDVSLGECYNNAFGVFFRFQGQHVLKTLEVENVACSVGSEAVSFGDLKARYR